MYQNHYSIDSQISSNLDSEFQAERNIQHVNSDIVNRHQQHNDFQELLQQIDFFSINTNQINDFFMTNINDQNQTAFGSGNNINLNQNLQWQIFLLNPNLLKNLKKYQKMNQYQTLYDQAINLFKNKKYQQSLQILFQLKKQKENFKVIKKIAICFVNLNNFSNAIKFAKILKDKYDRMDVSYQIKGCAYIKRAIKQKKIFLAKKSIYYLSQAFTVRQTQYNRKLLERAEFVKYYMAVNKKQKKQKCLQDYLKKLKVSESKFFYFKNLDFDQKIPDYLKDVISLDIFNQPYLTPSGSSYEKRNLCKMFQRKNQIKDPLTRQIIFKKDCIINKTLLQISLHLKKKYPYLTVEEFTNNKNFSLQILNFNFE